MRNFRLNFYKNHGVQERLQKQVDFDATPEKSPRLLAFVQSYLDEMETFIGQHEDELRNQSDIHIKTEQGIF